MKINKLFAILFAVLGVNTLSAQTWTDITNGNGNTFTTQYANPSSDDVFETWTGTASTTHAFDWNQTVTNIPDGVYELSANAMYRASLTYGTPTNCVLYATVGDYEYTTPIANFGDYSSNENLAKIATQMQNNDAYKNKIGNIIIENGEAKIGIKSIGDLAYCTNGYWFVCKKSTFTFKNVTDTYFTGLQKKINKMLAYASESEAKTTLNTALSTYNTATVENIKGLQAAITDFMNTASTSNLIDVTSYIANPSFEDGSTTYWYQDLGYTQSTNRNVQQPTDWNLMYSSAKVGNTQYQSFMPQTDGAKDGYCLYVRHRWGDVYAVEDLRQSVKELPAGQYQLVVAVKGGSSVTDANTLTLSAGSNSVTTTISDFDKSNYKDYTVTVTKATDEDPLNICYGLSQKTGNEQLYYIDDFRLYYLGEDLSIYKDMYNNTRDNAIAARDNSDYTIITGLEKTNLVNVINQTIEETKEAYLSAISALETATTAFTAAKSNYDALATEKEIAAGLGMSEDAIATATATTKTGLDALQDLKVAEYNYIQQTYTEAATLGSWTEDFGGDLDSEGYKVSGPKYMDDWQGSNVTRTAKQTITLPAGNYALSVIARGQAGASGYLYYKYGETTSQVNLIMKGSSGRGVDVDGVANFSDEGTYNNNGNGFGWEYRFITFNLAEETAVEIGASATIQGQWASIYAPVLLTTEASIKTLRMTEITNLLSEVPTGKMDATVQSTLNTKKAAAEAASLENSIEELATITTELNEAITAAKASIADYELIAGYIAKANKIDESIAADDQTAYDNGTISESPETVFQNLEVATYNYVTKTFNYNVAISNTWNSTGTNTSAKEFNNEHWSGETRGYMNQNDDNGQGWNAQSWSLDFDQEVELPAGEYVFKVAGRKSKDATLQLVVTQGEETLGTVEDFPNGSIGRGINKAGAASFDANDPEGFTRDDGTGYGWQWRYVKFTLTEKSTVKIAVHAETSAHQNWVSFGDYTVQMSEDTYLEANMGGLDAPTAAAQALVDTKPMGDAENTALKEALEMTFETGAELQAKINALNEAVANANAWVAAYNEAKAPLVAALERFETDYNNGEEGALDYMAQGRWATVIEMVEAAAEAKDVTNSYAGFETATTNLNAALDAADKSIADYKALKEAIDNANELIAVEVNWGDKPFQRPTSAKSAIETTGAQTVYDNAEADGDDVTSVTAALNNAFTLNAPEEGQSFYLTVATAGHVFEGYPIVATLGSTGDNNPTGYGFTAKTEEILDPKLYTFTKVEGNKYNISFEMDGETVYLTYGSLNGSAADWKDSQIQGTTDASVAGEFEIVASNTTEGGIKLRNTVTNEFLDCQPAGNNPGSIYTDTGMENDEFIAIDKDTELSANINISTDNKISTCVLQFNVELPDGLKAYVSEGLEGSLLTLKEVADNKLFAYTPSLLLAVNGYQGTLKGTIVMDGYKATVTNDEILSGAIRNTEITDGYILQNQGDGAKFYPVKERTATIPAGKCWLLTQPETGSTTPAAASIFLSFRGGGANDIHEIEADKPAMNGAIYTLEGKRVSSMERGKIYIINGQKVIVK